MLFHILSRFILLAALTTHAHAASAAPVATSTSGAEQVCWRLADTGESVCAIHTLDAQGEVNGGQIVYAGRVTFDFDTYAEDGAAGTLYTHYADSRTGERLLITFCNPCEVRGYTRLELESAFVSFDAPLEPTALRASLSP